MEFLNPSEKIKRIRKSLKMKQYEFEDELLSRSYFSMIECGQRTLTPEFAEIIFKKLKNKACELGVQLSVESQCLARTAAEDASEYCKNKLSQDCSIAELDKLMEIAETHELTHIQNEVYIRNGDILVTEGNYEDALLYYNLSIDLSKKIKLNKLLPSLYNKLGKCKYYDLAYKESILYFDFAYHYSIEFNDEEIKQNALFNMAMSCKKSSQIDNAIKYINIYINNCDKITSLDRYIYASGLKANCYNEINNVNEAIEIYTSLVDYVTDSMSPLLGYIYNNLGCLYGKKNDLPLSIDYFNKSQEIRTSVDRGSLSHTIIDKANIYLNQHLYNESILLLELGISLSIEYKDNEYLLKAYYMLVNIYKNKSNYKKLEETYLKLCKLVENRKNTFQVVKLYLELHDFYLKNKDFKNAIYYSELTQKYIDLCVDNNI